jgi:hypothetical protein
MTRSSPPHAGGRSRRSSLPLLAIVVAAAALSSVRLASAFVFPDPLPGDWVTCEEGAKGVPGAMAYNVTDGVRTRCFIAVLPEGVPDEVYPLPVIFIFHGKNGDASECPGYADLADKYMVDYGKQYGFIVICLESTMYNMTSDSTGKSGPGGLWSVPFSQNTSTGPRCEDSDSVDAPYMRSVMAQLRQCPDVFDMSRLSFHGCSAGSTAAMYVVACHTRPPRVLGLASGLNCCPCCRASICRNGGRICSKTCKRHELSSSWCLSFDRSACLPACMSVCVH